jgi:hypothetical protein
VIQRKILLLIFLLNSITISAQGTLEAWQVMNRSFHEINSELFAIYNVSIHDKLKNTLSDFKVTYANHVKPSGKFDFLLKVHGNIYQLNDSIIHERHFTIQKDKVIEADYQNRVLKEYKMGDKNFEILPQYIQNTDSTYFYPFSTPSKYQLFQNYSSVEFGDVVNIRGKKCYSIICKSDQKAGEMKEIKWYVSLDSYLPLGYETKNKTVTFQITNFIPLVGFVNVSLDFFKFSNYYKLPVEVYRSGKLKKSKLKTPFEYLNLDYTIPDAKMPDWSVLLSTGEEISSTDVNQKITVLHLISLNYGNGIKNIDALIRLQKKYGNDLEIIHVDMCTVKGKIDPYFKRKDITLNFVPDGSAFKGVLQTAHDASLYVFDKNGKLIHAEGHANHFSYDNWDKVIGQSLRNN